MTSKLLRIQDPEVASVVMALSLHRADRNLAGHDVGARGELAAVETSAALSTASKIGQVV